METVRVTLEGVQGEPLGSMDTDVNVTVTAQYTSELLLKDGTIIPRVIATKFLGSNGKTQFEVYPCDGPEIADGYDGVGVKFTAIITDARGRPMHPWSRTVKVSTGGPWELGLLPAARPFTPEEWKDIEDLAGPIRDAAEAAADAAQQSASDAQSAATDAAHAIRDNLATDINTPGSPAYEAIADVAGSITDPQIASMVANPGSDTHASLENYSASRETFVLATDYAAADGITDDTASLLSAVGAAPQGGTVLLPPGTEYALSGPLTVTGVTIQADGATLTKTGETSGHWIKLGDGARLVGARIDPNGLATSTVVMAESCTSATVEDCTIVDAEAATDAIRFTDTIDGRIVGNTIDGSSNAVRIVGSAVGLVSSENNIRNWQTRGINVNGVGGLRNATFNANRITDPNIVKVFGDPGHVGQPFSIQGDDTTPHVNVYVTNNVIVGNGHAEEDTTLSGVAGCLSMHRVHGGVVSGNLCTDGGEDGYTFALGCKNLTVTGNVAIRMDGPGFHLRAPGSTYTGNAAINCGLDRAGGKETSNTYSLSGFRINGVNVPGMRDCTFVGNAAIDDQGTPTMKYGVSIRDTQNMVFSANVFQGVTERYAIDPASTTNANLAWTDENSSPSEDTHVSLTVEPGWATGSEAEAWARGGYVILSLRFRPSSGTAAGTTLASLPVGMRPPATIRASAVNTSGEGYDINIRANGNISPTWSGSPSNFANCSVTIPL